MGIFKNMRRAGADYQAFMDELKDLPSDHQDLVADLRASTEADKAQLRESAAQQYQKARSDAHKKAIRDLAAQVEGLLNDSVDNFENRHPRI